jgi:hypothetical protein
VAVGNGHDIDCDLRRLRYRGVAKESNQMTTSPDEPVLVFTGPLTELEFVKSFLSASGIPWSVSPLWAESNDVASLSVRHCDYDRAKAFIDDFQRHGKRSRG